MRAEIDFEFIDKGFEVLHPVCGIGRVHKTGFKPTPCGAVKVREDEEDLLLIINECMGMVLEVEVAGH